ncbi:MAG: PAS domain S-box protein [Methylobacter sp.]
MQSIIDFLIDFLGVKGFIPHGYCLSWDPLLLWLHLISDLLITLSYYSIPLILVYFIRQRKDLPYPWLVAMFAGFIIACGTTHLMSAITIWIPLYWLDGLFKAITAIISVATAVLMLWIVPRALSLPSTVQLQAEIQQRKAAEDALRKSQLELQEAQRIAHVGSWQLDIATDHVAWSDELYRMLGLNPKLPPPDYSEHRRLFTHESWERLNTALLHTQETGGPYELELEMIKADGTHGWMLARGEAVRDGNDAIVRLQGVVLNITERKCMENELKASEAKFRSIIEVSPVPMMLHDERLNMTFLNPAFVQVFGYNMDDIPTVADWWAKAFADPEQRHRIEAGWQTALEKARQQQTDFPPVELAIRCKNNSVKTVLADAATHQDFAGEHLVMLYDITGLKQIEAKLNAIFNALVEGIITTDMYGNIQSANAAVETVFGYKPEQLEGCSISKLMPSMQTEAVRCIGRIQEIEGMDKNGSALTLELSIADFLIDDACYFAHIVRDVSSRKHREQQDKEHLDELAHVTRLGLMGEMASGIAHEVNQPLAAISSYAQVSLNLIKAENPDLVKLAEVLYKTQQQALRAGRIIHRMRDFVKSHAKHRSTADLNTLVHYAADLCIAELKQNNIKLTFELQHNLPAVYVDHVQIEQIILNLIRNSVDALKNLPVKQQRQLTIQSHLTTENVLEVRVKDNGPGLDKDQQHRILTPFYTTKSDGMGMGLSISRSLVEAHDGSLHFNSQPGKGTSFYFTLPVQQKV